MSAPVLAELRPVTVADLEPGQSLVPGTMLFAIQTLPVSSEIGLSSHFYSVHVWLPREFRAPTAENAKAAMSYLREYDPDARKEIDKIAAIARDPRSRRRARELGMTERFYDGAEADAILGRIRPG